MLLASSPSEPGTAKISYDGESIGSGTCLDHRLRKRANINLA